MKRSFRIKLWWCIYLHNPRHQQLDKCDFLLKNDEPGKITAGNSGKS